MTMKYLNFELRLSHIGQLLNIHKLDTELILEIDNSKI